MITHIRGRLVEKTPAYAVIECAGIGYYINISLHTFSKIGMEENCMLYTHFIVREDAQMLFGFADEDERQIFRNLITVSGVGANTARMILSSLSPGETRQAILSGNVAALNAVKGIGAKTAQRLIVDLKDKITVGETSDNNFHVEGNTNRSEALSALSVLGIDRRKAEKVVDKLMGEGGELPVEEIIKRALKSI